ncbi:uncharacterized protein BDW43DRAFT_294292 [Aspergillus alliaceus]|uniref:uncharacterized protein n=1 Tax=Petromyces alliaceus TaxID=209559 RepID=UPI0012A66F2F|nr:uncharacterized protein BDW43DRAFT_294292 [Aspergillus alliaceus]KAB8227388.1 hypothetical protein BDW43DRAFT_294292 [Aspergillus alliaceus]
MFPVLEELDLAWEFQDIDYSDAIEEEEHFFNRIAYLCIPISQEVHSSEHLYFRGSTAFISP